MFAVAKVAEITRASDLRQFFADFFRVTSTYIKPQKDKFQ
jgi:hypothetical protein